MAAAVTLVVVNTIFIPVLYLCAVWEALLRAQIVSAQQRKRRSGSSDCGGGAWRTGLRTLLISRLPQAFSTRDPA